MLYFLHFNGSKNGRMKIGKNNSVKKKKKKIEYNVYSIILLLDLAIY